MGRFLPRGLSLGLGLLLAFVPLCSSFLPATSFASKIQSVPTSLVLRQGWFDNFFPQLNDSEAEDDRRNKFPEQYPATYAMSATRVSSDSKEAAIVRPLLKQTQLEERRLQLAYDASRHGWSSKAFHTRIDKKVPQ